MKESMGEEKALSTRRRGGGISATIAAAMALIIVSATSRQARAQEPEEDRGLSGPLAEQLDEYWSVDRELPMIRERLYELDGRFGIGVLAGVVPSEPFYVYVPLGGRLSYFFSNELGVELSGAYALSMPTQLNTFLSDQRQGGFDATIDTEDRFIWNGEAVLSWHPLYGKWAVLQRKLSHLDFSLVGGAGAIGMTRPDALRTTSTSTVQPALVFGAGLGFFVGERGALLRADWRSRAYLGPEFETAQFADQGFFDRLQVPSEFTLGFSYLF